MIRFASASRRRLASRSAAGFCVLLLAAAAAAQPVVTTIPVGASREHPESLTALRDGTLLFSALGKAAVYRIEPGRTVAAPFIAGALGDVTGVFADAGTLWVCSSAPAGGAGATAVRSYVAATGAPVATFPFPGGGVCGDFAVGRNGTVFVSDPAGGRLLSLARGALQLAVFAENPELLAGLTGLAVVDAKLYGSTSAGKLVLFDVTDAGLLGRIIDLPLSQPLDTPDGMRVLEDDTGLLLVDRTRLLRVTFRGRNAVIEVIREGFNGATGVAQIGANAFVVEAKTDYLTNPALGDPGPFVVHIVPLP